MQSNDPSSHPLQPFRVVWYAFLALWLMASGCTPSVNPSVRFPQPALESDYALPKPSPGGRYFYVDNQNPIAGDQNPGSLEQPLRSVGQVLTRLKPGDVAVVRAGVYRESLSTDLAGTAERPITLVAFPGEPVVISGADIISDWQSEGELWWTTWHQSLPVLYPSGPGIEYRFAARREQVIQRESSGERLLQQVAQKSDLQEGQFWVQGSDLAPERLYLKPFGNKKPSEITLEVSTRSKLLEVLEKARYIHLIGLNFRYASNAIQQKAVEVRGSHMVLDHIRVEWTNAVGIGVGGSDNQILNSASSHNGQLGWGAGGGCTGCVYQSVQATGNNWKGYDPNWEAGGAKLVASKNIVFRHFFAADNNGPGLWFDETNSGHRVEESVFDNNQMAGIKLELNASDIKIVNNIVQNTRFYRLTGDGIQVIASQNNQILHNTITHNQGAGISVIYDQRAAADANQTLNNIISDNKNAVYFNNNFARSLGDNRFDGNLYWRGYGEDLFVLDIGGSRNQKFITTSDLGQWQQQVQSDTGSLIANPLFLENGWRIGGQSPARGLAKPVSPPIAYDFEGNPRPALGADTGANQYKN